MNLKSEESNVIIYGGDTCRKEVLPKLKASNWTDDLILEQRTFTDGKISVIGRKAKRKKVMVN